MRAVATEALPRDSLTSIDWKMSSGSGRNTLSPNECENRTPEGARALSQTVRPATRELGPRDGVDGEDPRDLSSCLKERKAAGTLPVNEQGDLNRSCNTARVRAGKHEHTCGSETSTEATVRVLDCLRHDSR